MPKTVRSSKKVASGESRRFFTLSVSRVCHAAKRARIAPRRGERQVHELEHRLEVGSASGLRRSLLRRARRSARATETNFPASALRSEVASKVPMPPCGDHRVGEARRFVVRVGRERRARLARTPTIRTSSFLNVVGFTTTRTPFLSVHSVTPISAIVTRGHDRAGRGRLAPSAGRSAAASSYGAIVARLDGLRRREDGGLGRFLHRRRDP